MSQWPTKNADAIPSNTGAVVGKCVDVATGSDLKDCSNGQLVLGGVNDVMTFVFSAGNSGAVIKIAEGATRKYKNYLILEGLYEYSVGSFSIVESQVTFLMKFSDNLKQDKNKKQETTVYIVVTD